MENKTPLQELIAYIDDKFKGSMFVEHQFIREKAQSLLPLEKEFAEDVWEASYNYWQCEVANAPDFPTWFSRYELEKPEQSSNQ